MNFTESSLTFYRAMESAIMKQQISKLNSECGATSVEYAFILGLIVAVYIVASTSSCRESLICTSGELNDPSVWSIVASGCGISR
jgi:Flp pilus assembly pilin Flp